MEKTIRQVLREIRELGACASYRAEYREFRVSLPGVSRAEAEAGAYYTNDGEDAIATAKRMVTPSPGLRVFVKVTGRSVTRWAIPADAREL